ncbi:MAG: ribosomal protein S18-alanine N-acetyltransferase [Bacteroidetes bacterium]|nr:ribosomal protein S18-alanine N-acetyltransferase [Bacteroidota bacterium]
MIADPVQRAQIRLMRPEDIDQVMAIENLSFDSPWTKNNFLDEFKNSDLSTQLVIELDGRIAAFAIVWIIIDECHLANIAVHPDVRRGGLGRLFLARILEMARERKCKQMMLEVRKSNKSALELYRQFGFYMVGARKNYYHDGFLRYEDAVLMNLDL